MPFNQRQRGDIKRAFPRTVSPASIERFLDNAEAAAAEFRAVYTAPAPARMTRNEILRRRADSAIRSLRRYAPRAADAAHQKMPESVIRKRGRGRPATDAVLENFVESVYLAYLEAVDYNDTARGFEHVLETVCKVSDITVSRHARKFARASVRKVAAELGALWVEENKG